MMNVFCKSMYINHKFDRIKASNCEMPSAIAIATKKKRSTDKPVHAHLRRFNLIINYVHIIVIMCAAAGYGVRVSVTHMGK